MSSSSLSTLSYFIVSFISLPFDVELCSFSLFHLSILLVSLSARRGGAVHGGGRGSWVLGLGEGRGSWVFSHGNIVLSTPSLLLFLTEGFDRVLPTLALVFPNHGRESVHLCFYLDLDLRPTTSTTTTDESHQKCHYWLVIVLLLLCWFRDWVFFG